MLNQDSIKFDEEKRELHFEKINLRFAADTPTAWKKNDKSGGHYNLATLWFFSQMKKASTGVYTKECHAKNISAVTFMDKKPLDAFFTKAGDMPSNVD